LYQAGLPRDRADTARFAKAKPNSSGDESPKSPVRFIEHFVPKSELPGASDRKMAVFGVTITAYISVVDAIMAGKKG
jgi:hypothetical protein